MNLVFFGPPAVGKGTIAQRISEEKGIPHISTGTMLRAAAKAGTPLGKRAAAYIDMGRLVPDEIVLPMLLDRLKDEDALPGFILDGFPRTKGQAEALDNHHIKIDKVVYFTAKMETIIERVTGRRTCTKCGRIFHLKNIPTEKKGVCDECGGKLEQRADDTEETVRKRLAIYEDQTAPLIEFYKKKGILAAVNTERPIPEIVKKTNAVIG